MKLTLWLLNRITQWEVNHPGELAQALAGIGTRHDVRLGRRILATTPFEAGTVEFIVNDTEPSFRGELMHEG